MRSDGRAFLGAFLRDPRSIGSVWPSAPALARALVDAADCVDGHHVVELGAGTGPMTAELATRVPATDLLVLEPEPGLAARCRARVPGATVVEARAEALPALVQARGGRPVDRVVSSLPFASFPAPLQRAVLDAVVDVLAPDGRLVTFTYVTSPWTRAGRRAQAMLAARFAAVRTTPVVWANLPPAFVYVATGPIPRSASPTTTGR